MVVRYCLKDGRLAMIHSLKYDYYKFPGGGIEEGESHSQALIREVAEETGLTVLPGSIREFGYVRRVEKGRIEDIFVQDNFYYLCGTAEGIGAQSLDDYESEEQFVLEFVTAVRAAEVNRTHPHGEKDLSENFRGMNERETRVLMMLADEGIV